MSQQQSPPGRLSEVLDLLAMAGDRAERLQLLIGLGEAFHQVEVDEEVASPPYDEERRVPGCESQAFVFSRPDDAGALEFRFAVENPQGVSARALAAILGRSLSGVPVAEVARVEPEIVFDLFGNELSMGKSLGLTNMVAMVRREARRAMEAEQGARGVNGRAAEPGAHSADPQSSTEEG